MGQLFNNIVGQMYAEKRSRDRIAEEREYRKQMRQEELDWQEQQNIESGVAGYMDQGMFNIGEQPVVDTGVSGGILPADLQQYQRQQTQVGSPVYYKQLMENPRAYSMYEQAYDRMHPDEPDIPGAPTGTVPVIVPPDREDMLAAFPPDENGVSNVPNSIVGDLFPDEPDIPGAPTGTVPVIVPPDREDILAAFPPDENGVSNVPTSIATSIFADGGAEGADGMKMVDLKRAREAFDARFGPTIQARLGMGSAYDLSGEAEHLFVSEYGNAEGSITDRTEKAYEAVISQYPNLTADPGEIAYAHKGKLKFGTPRGFEIKDDKNIVDVKWRKEKEYKTDPETIEKMLTEGGLSKEDARRRAQQFTNYFPSLAGGEDYAFVRAYLTEDEGIVLKEKPDPGDVEVPDTEQVITADDALKDMSLEELQNRATDYGFQSNGQNAAVDGALDDMFK